jgi:two-component system, cell cycle sensor histidine kinase and response regulator CckA
MDAVISVSARGRCQGGVMRSGTDPSDAQPARQTGVTGLAATPLRSPLIIELLESLPDPVIGCDAAGRVVYWSKAARNAYGYSTEEAVGEHAIKLLRTRLPRPLLEITEELTDLGHWRGRLVHRTKDGRDVAVESRWVARRDDAGRLVGGFGVERDFSAVSPLAGELVPVPPAESLDRELRQAERLETLGQVAGGVAHDFNNALGIVINYAAFVSAEVQRLRSTPTDAQRATIRQDLDEISAAAERAAKLTNQLLAFSRQEEGEPRPVDLNASVREIEQLLTHTVGEHIRVELGLVEGLPLVSADPAQVQQVLVNLAVNARDAMPTGGTLTIQTGNVDLDAAAAAALPDPAPGRYVRLQVSDTGVGMTAEVLERAFDPFFTTKPRSHGNGLGLSSVYWIITRAGGQARLESEPGVGTSFVALLPALHDPPAAAAPDGQDGRVQAADGTILLVEDERPLRDIARRILVSAGYDVIAAGDGFEALDLAGAHDGTIDLLLTDMVMPGLQGHQLADRLRAVRPAIAVVYLSGHSGPLLGPAAHLQPSALIAKPFTAPALLEYVRQALAARG